MRLLLDTQSFLSAIDTPERLSKRARVALDDHSNEILVSAVTAWEIAIKSSIGHLQLPDEPQRFVPEQMALNSFTPLAIIVRHALKTAELPTDPQRSVRSSPRCAGSGRGPRRGNSGCSDPEIPDQRDLVTAVGTFSVGGRAARRATG